MLKWKSNENRIGGGYAPSNVSHGKRLWLSIILSFLCAALLCCAFLLPLNKTASAYTSANMPTGENAIGQIYKTNGDFDAENLDKLATKAGYTNLYAMATAAESGAIKTAEDFGNITVNFGTYTFGSNTAKSLTWIPVYLSKSGNSAILTLWLASTASGNSVTTSNQEISTWTDGTYSTTATQSWYDSTIYSNTYDGSYIRNYVLNGNSNYTKAWGSGTATTVPAANSMTKFSQFINNGVLSSYIVTPSQVSWQATGNGRLKNDAGWNGSGATVKGSQANYPCSWLNDKLWLPSLFETNLSTVPVNSGESTASDSPIKGDGGLWKTGNSSNTSQRSNSVDVWLRSVDPCGFNGAFYLKNGDDTDNEGSALRMNVGSEKAVRPALHLNLTAVAEKVKASHIHNFGEWQVTKPATCTSVGEKTHTCTAAGCTLIGGNETQTIEKLEHSYSEEFIVDTPATCTTAGSQSRHCKNCDDKIEVTQIPALQHDWGEWVTVTAPTCTASGKQKHTCTREGCGATEEQAVAATGHKYTETVIPPTCTEDGYTKHTCFCGDSYDDTPTDATGHTYGEPAWNWGTNYLTATAKFSCSVCHSERTLNASVTHDSTTASCTVAGDVTHTATVNLDGTPYTEVKVAKGEKLPHDSEIVSVTVEPTCTQDGAGQMKCKNCGEEYTDIIPALGHDFAEEFTVDKEPTCTEDGSKSKHCSRCDEKDEVTAISALGHSYELVGWTWNEDYTASVDLECSVCKEHTSPEVTVTYDEETKPIRQALNLTASNIPTKRRKP